MTPKSSIAALHQSEFKTIVSRRLRETASDSRYSDIGAKTGHNPETVRRYMLGNSPPSAEFLVRFARAYGITLNWLLLGEGPKCEELLESFVVSNANLDKLFGAIAKKLAAIEGGSTNAGKTDLSDV